MWDYCGMGRTEEGLKKALELFPQLKHDFWNDLKLPGDQNEYNPELEKAGRLIDFIELGELMVRDALNRRESCGGHFREEMQTEEGEALRNDEIFAYVAAWQFKGDNSEPELNKEELKFEAIELKQRNYK
jgi:succinate dehydrogenase / fumarate reductase flavoprotein subunit